jgi:hypothetical protein
LLPNRNPKPRKISGNDSGDRSTKPDARAVTVNTTAITPKIRIKSDNRHLCQIASWSAWSGFQAEIRGYQFLIVETTDTVNRSS